MVQVASRDDESRNFMKIAPAAVLMMLTVWGLSGPAITTRGESVQVSGEVTYRGHQRGDVWVVATPGRRTLATNHSDRLTVPGAYTIEGLSTNTKYAVAAYLDTNSNQTFDAWEPIGHCPAVMAAFVGRPSSWNAPSLFTTNTTAFNIKLIDPDSDWDKVPDYKEIPLVHSDPDDKIKDIRYVFPRDDFDGDGISNGIEFKFDSDAADPASVPTTVYFAPSRQSCRESSTNVTVSFDVRISEPPTTSVSGRVAVIRGTATGKGIDYSFTDTGHFEFSNVRTSVTMNVTIMCDTNDLRHEFAEEICFGIVEFAGNARLVGRTTYLKFNQTWDDYVIHTLVIADYFKDTDSDGLPDWWETKYGLDPLDAGGVNGASGDGDKDQLINRTEYQAGSDPNVPMKWVSPETFGFKIVTPSRQIVLDAGADLDGQHSNDVSFVVASDDGSTPAASSGMVLIPAGSFEMGNKVGTVEGGGGGGTIELPVHTVYVSAFYMDKYEVTNDEMVDVLNWAYGQEKLTVSASTVRNAEGNSQKLLDLHNSECRIEWNGSSFVMKSAKGSGYPCVEVTWYGAVAYCNYLTEKEDGGLTPCYDFSDWSCNWTASGYRLPTEAEWEKAARGGASGQRFPWGAAINHDYANYSANGSAHSYDTSPYARYTFHPDYDDGGTPYTSPVGTFESGKNGYGLYDMAGNVWEWCHDWYGSNYYSYSPGSDPRGPASGFHRMLRGGSWYNYTYQCRVASRYRTYPYRSISYIGFRAVLPLGQ